jgi:O-methyltransferase involved in polyketide biosynthesis
MFGFSMPPFDIIWLMETIADYVDEGRVKENLRRINSELRENRLLYELGEITKEEYDKRNRELSHQRQMNRRVKRARLNQRINILG